VGTKIIKIREQKKSRNKNPGTEVTKIRVQKFQKSHVDKKPKNKIIV
jgi:hypothetical protein